MTITLLAIATPMALPQAAACTPATDQTFTTLPTPAWTLYVKTYTLVDVRGVAVPGVSQVWREANGLPGLQTDAEMTCGLADPDFFWVDGTPRV